MSEVRISKNDLDGGEGDGKNLFHALKEFDVPVKSYCGGSGVCGKCKVKVADSHGKLTGLTDAERNLLTEEELDKGYRLACQADLFSGEVVLEIPEYSRKRAQIILEDGQTLEVEERPVLKKLHVTLSEPSLDDPRGDYERLTGEVQDSYGIDVTDIDHRVQKSLPRALRNSSSSGDSYDLTVTLFDDSEIIGIDAGWQDELYGLAVDVGTTTIVSYLVDLNTGKTLAAESRVNPQVEVGGDIITRISSVHGGSVDKEEMRSFIISAVNDLIDDSLEGAGLERDDLYYSVFVGNTAMHHFALGIDPNYISRSPFVPGRQGKYRLKARDFGLDIATTGYVDWLPLTGGWVGADHVSTLLISEIYKQEEMTLVIDIGTNGEVAVGNSDGVMVTSAAAGPALEGYNIKHGMRAEQGSIERMNIDENTLEPSYETIGGQPPVGICGSGLLDAVAELLKCGVIDNGGRFQAGVDAERVREGENGQVEYVIVREEEAGIDGEVVITQGDVRELQKAKGAIQAATRVLMDEIGVEEIDRVLLGGAFGNYIDKESALTVGLFPEVDLSRISSMGNSAGEGAKVALLNKNKMEEAERISQFVEFVEIAGSSAFRDKFIESLNLPHKDLDLYPGVRDRLSGTQKV